MRLDEVVMRASSCEGLGGEEEQAKQTEGLAGDGGGHPGRM